MIFTKILEEEYQTFWQNHPYHNFLNSTEAMKLRKLNGLHYEYVGMKEDNTILCAACLVSYPLLKIFKGYSLQRGILIDYHDTNLLHTFITELKKYLKKQHAILLEVDPSIPLIERDEDGNVVEGGFDNHYVVDALKAQGFMHKPVTNQLSSNGQVGWVFVMDVHGSEEEVLKSLDQQTRWSIHRSIKDQIQIRELEVNEIDLFIHMEKETAQRRNFEMRSSSFYHNQKEAYKEHEKVMLAYLDCNISLETLQKERESLLAEQKEIQTILDAQPSKKFQKKLKVNQEAIDINTNNTNNILSLQKEHGTIIPLATGVYIVYDFEVVYLFSATYDAFRKYNAPYALQWEMIKYCIHHNIPRYNFYGISGNFEPTASDYGIYRFKKGFTGHVEQLVGTFTLPISPLLYKLFSLRHH